MSSSTPNRPNEFSAPESRELTHPGQPALQSANRPGFGMGFLLGLLSGALLTVGLGGVVWFTQFRTATATAPTVPAATAPMAPSASSPIASTGANQGASQDTTQGTSQTSTASSSAPASASSAAGLAPSASGLNLQKTHPDGATLRIDSVSFSDDSINLALSITNGSQDEIKLNSTTNIGGNSAMYLQDNLGNQYPVVPPANNDTVKIGAASTANGQFRFMGLVHPEATSLMLVTNPGTILNNSATTTPNFKIGGIPVQR